MMKIVNVDGAHNVLLDFVRSLAGSYPNFKFEFTDWITVVVSQDLEHIGRLEVHTSATSDGTVCSIALSSKKIKAERQRRGPMKTKDLRKAAKLFAQYFEPLDRSKLMEELKTKVASKISSLRQQGLKRTSDQFLALLCGPKLPEIASALESFIDMSELQTTITTTLSLASNGVIITQRGDKYFIQYNKDSRSEECTADTLPHNLRANLAMLKLVENDTIIADRGLRVLSNLFVVLEDNDG
jgi:hypothetical protein